MTALQLRDDDEMRRCLVHRPCEISSRLRRSQSLFTVRQETAEIHRLPLLRETCPDAQHVSRAFLALRCCFLHMAISPSSAVHEIALDLPEAYEPGAG